MIQKLGMEADKVAQLNVPLYKRYGTTMAGLKVLIFFINLQLNCIRNISLDKTDVSSFSCPLSPGNWL